ncbi:MAG: arylsulfatase [Gemmatimonadaceae bacterium]|jgi:arylsulfatase A|nr:arylsulfatase [Gemmatimonadaceae bacterium]MCC6433113.1 arylsulfatase [Gemmatimonadaceae bacterium]
MTLRRARARLLSLAVMASALLPAAATRLESQPTQRPPNIIYIMADDLGWAELGSYGQTKILTPHLDRLAREGVRFTRFYSASPVCAPSRSALLTGLHTGHSPVRGNFELGGYLDSEERGQYPLPTGTQTIATVLKARGYATAIVGKWGLGGPASEGIPNRHGFDFFYGYLDQKQAHNHYPTHLWRNEVWDTLPNAYFAPHQKLDSVPTDPRAYDRYKGTAYAPDRMTAEALRFIREKQGTPFFLYLAYTIPHLALQVPDEELLAYSFPETPYLGAQGYLPHPRPRAAYAGMISRMDKHVGQVLALLRELGLDSTTMVVFTSDNGTTYTGGAEPKFFESVKMLRGLKDAVYEGGIRVPFIARWPGRIPSGRVTDQLAANWDVLPTIAELAGAPVRRAVDGVSFADALRGNGPSRPHAPMYWEHHGVCGGQQAVRDGAWKAIQLGVGTPAPAPLELYNLDTDPGERHNVAAEHPEIVRRMRESLARLRAPAILPAWNFMVDSAARARRPVNYETCAPGKVLPSP